MQADFTYPYTLPVAKPLDFIELDSSKTLPDVLRDAVPEKIAKIALTVAASGTTFAPSSYKTKEWSIVAFSEGEAKRAFITERNHRLGSKIDTFSCKRSIMVLYNSDTSVSVQEVARYSQAKIDSKAMEQKQARMLSTMQQFAHSPCFATNYAFVQQGRHIRFFQQRANETLQDLYKKENGLETLPEADKLDICYGIAQAIDTLAKKGFTHRAISLDRIILSRSSGSIEVKLTDFSHATRHGDWDARELEVGNISWAAPESIQFMISKGNHQLSDEQQRQNCKQFAERIAQAGSFAAINPFDVTHELLANGPRLLPDSSADVWTLGLIIHSFAQKNLLDIQVALSRIEQEKIAFSLISEAIMLCSKECDKSEKKKLERMLEGLKQFPFTKLAGPLENLLDVKLFYLFRLSMQRVQESCEVFENALLSVPKAPSTLNTLLDLAYASMQTDPQKRLSTQQVVDAILALKIKSLSI